MKKRLNKLIRLSSRKRAAILLAALLVLLVLLAAYTVWRNTIPKVEVTYFEAGQGDAILIRSSDHKVVLIDGSYPNSGVLSRLQAKGVQRIDLVVVTHPHDDHTGGISEVLGAIPVDKVVSNGQPLDSPIYAEYEKALQGSGAPHEIVKAGDVLHFGRLSLEVLAPPGIYAVAHNNNSVVTRLVVGKVKFLFVGDAMVEEETWMVESGVPLYAQILKVGHHAADTSSSPAFIQRVSPSVAIYTAESGNIHGFPHQAALDTLLSSGAKVYGTDVNGTITVTTDGTTYTVTAERGGPRTR